MAMSIQQERTETAARRVSELVPDELTVDRTTLRVDADRASTAASHEGDAALLEAGWSHGPARGEARIEIRPDATMGSDLFVRLEPPAGWWRLLWPAPRRSLEARHLVRALRTEVETRAAQGTGRVAARRTSRRTS